MKTITRTDILFAVVRRMGRTVYNSRLTGYESMADVLRDVHDALSGIGGIVTLQLRNGSQGWSGSHVMCL